MHAVRRSGAGHSRGGVFLVRRAGVSVVSTLLTFAEAETLGEALHDHWVKMAGEANAPSRTDLAWPDVCQFVLRKAGEIIDQRESAMEGGDGR